jgi:hypothetical protein
MGAKNAAAGETHDGWWVCGVCVKEEGGEGGGRWQVAG